MTDYGNVVSLEEHRRVRDMARSVRRRAEALERERDKLTRLLGTAMLVATRNGQDADPMVTLGLLEELDARREPPPVRGTKSEPTSLQQLRDEDEALWAAWREVTA